jgi:hypothetical protein
LASRKIAFADGLATLPFWLPNANDSLHERRLKPLPRLVNAAKCPVSIRLVSLPGTFFLKNIKNY